MTYRQGQTDRIRLDSSQYHIRICFNFLNANRNTDISGY
jgi:hypothetical protein